MMMESFFERTYRSEYGVVACIYRDEVGDRYKLDALVFDEHTSVNGALEIHEGSDDEGGNRFCPLNWLLP